MNFIKQIAKAILKIEIDSYKSQIDKLVEVNKQLGDKIEDLTYSSPKEKYYNNKYSKINKKYYKQINGVKESFDVRCFVGNYNNLDLPTFQGTHDEIALQTLNWTVKNLTYKYDSKYFGMVEYWAMSYETLLNKCGDCEDGAILIYDTLRANGIPAWKLRITVGWAVNPFNGNAEMHAYLMYYSEDYDKWITLDWCFLPNQTPMEEQPHYKDVSFYGEVRWSFNEDYCWSKAK